MEIEIPITEPEIDVKLFNEPISITRIIHKFTAPLKSLRPLAGGTPP